MVAEKTAARQWQETRCRRILAMIPSTPMTWKVAPCFIVNDVVFTANFYRDKLGFHYERF